MTDDERSGGVGGAVGPPRVIVAACAVLLITGVGSALFSGPVIFNPASARCHLSRTWVDDANTDKKEWNNVDTGGQKPKDLPCAEAIRLADQIRLKENGDQTASVPGEGALRIQAGLAVVFTLGQAVSGWLVLRRLSRTARNAAMGFAAAGVILRVLGIISLGVFALVIYAFAFSRESKAIWPRQTRAG